MKKLLICVATAFLCVSNVHELNAMNILKIFKKSTTIEKEDQKELEKSIKEFRSNLDIMLKYNKTAKETYKKDFKRLKEDVKSFLSFCKLAEKNSVDQKKIKAFKMDAERIITTLKSWKNDQTGTKLINEFCIKINYLYAIVDYLNDKYNKQNQVLEKIHETMFDMFRSMRELKNDKEVKVLSSETEKTLQEYRRNLRDTLAKKLGKRDLKILNEAEKQFNEETKLVYNSLTKKEKNELKEELNVLKKEFKSLIEFVKSDASKPSTNPIYVGKLIGAISKFSKEKRAKIIDSVKKLYNNVSDLHSKYSSNKILSDFLYITNKIKDLRSEPGYVYHPQQHNMSMNGFPPPPPPPQGVHSIPSAPPHMP